MNRNIVIFMIDPFSFCFLFLIVVFLNSGLEILAYSPIHARSRLNSFGTLDLKVVGKIFYTTNTFIAPFPCSMPRCYCVA